MGGEVRLRHLPLFCLTPILPDHSEFTSCGNLPLSLALLASCIWELFTVAQLKCLLKTHVCIDFQISILARVTDTHTEISASAF